MVASSNFKAPGFTEAVMQMNFWITHYLAHLNTLSSSWYFCVYFRQAQAFPCIPTASLTLDISYFFWQRRIEIRWYLGQQTSIIITRITSILLGLGSRGLKKNGDIMSFGFHVTKWSMCHLTLWVRFTHPMYHPPKFGVHRPYESGNLTFFICHVITTSKSHVGGIL